MFTFHPLDVSIVKSVMKKRGMRGLLKPLFYIEIKGLEMRNEWNVLEVNKKMKMCHMFKWHLLYLRICTKHFPPAWVQTVLRTTCCMCFSALQDLQGLFQDKNRDDLLQMKSLGTSGTWMHTNTDPQRDSWKMLKLKSPHKRQDVQGHVGNVHSMPVTIPFR